MELDQSFATRLQWAMQIKTPPVTQADLARALGVSAQAIQQWASGSTANPRRDKVKAAADHLGVRYDWLAYARGPMRAGEGGTDAPASASTETALLGREWELALAQALPADAQDRLNRTVSHPNGTSRFRVDYLSDTVLADLGLYRTPAGIVRARERLWQLVVARELVPPAPGRRVILLLAPLEDWLDTPERHIEALRSEARLLGVEVVHARTPLDAAAVLLGQATAPAAPIEDDLGLDTSPVL